MVVVLDDLLWIDKSSEELLSQVIDVVAGARILLILAYRPDYVHSWASKPFYNQVRVDQLPLADSRQMVEHVLGFEGSSHDVIDLTVQRTQGNPLYIEEFVDALKESGTVRKAGDSRALSAAVSEAAIPAAVQAIVADRIDRLEPGARQVLQVASAIGTEFSIGLLQDAMQVKDALGPHLRELQSLGFIYQASVFPDPTWVFRHVLTRDVAYVSLTSAARRRIHQRIGQSIEERHAERLAEFYEVLAHHFALSHDWQRACRYLKLAAGRAARNFSNWEALQLYKDALEICSRRKETPECTGERLAIRLEMDAVLRCLDYPDGSLENLKAARREAVELSDFRAEALVHSKIGWYYSFRGRTAFGLRHTRAAFVQAMKTKDIRLVVPISLDLCLSYMAMGNLSLLADVASPAILLLEEQGHESEYSSGLHHANLYCELLSYLGLGLASIGEIERGKDACARALEVAYRVDKPASIGLCLHFSGHTFWAQGDWKSVVKCQRRAIRFLSKAGSSIPLGACWGNLGVAYAMLGKHNAAAECVDRGLRIHAEGGAAAFTSNFYWARGIVELNEGNIGNARCAFEESLSLAETYGQMFAQGTASMYLGRTRSQGKLGASNEARKSILRGMNIFHRLHLEPFYTQGLLFLGEHYASVGDKKNALRNLKKAEGLFTQMGMDYWLKKTQEALRTL
jgi:tetratricopeptide (TPR) repeat protein